MSNKSKRSGSLFFRLAFRLALYSSMSVILILVLILNIVLSWPFQDSLLASISVGLLVFIVTYFFSWKFQHQRLETIYKISKNITRKKFEEYDEINTVNRDELDHLITQSIRASKTVEREIQRLNKIENYRKEFIGDISHELKTPIFAIQGFVETLLNGALEDKEVNRVFLNKAMRNINRLTFLTKDLMEISKLETGELKSSIQDLYLRNVILDVVESLQYKAQKENVQIQVNHIDKNLQVRADRNQIKQVLVNLIENGVKYNKPGGFVYIGVKDFPRNRNKVLLYVEDTGIGIEQPDLVRVTERFFRVDKSRSREKGGTGLGLSIVKHIIEAHGEKLFIESTVNKGTTFSFTLTRSGGEYMI
jgi:two-component system, OmpR family, phosphate regulon sensor histidine kinase PhoR